MMEYKVGDCVLDLIDKKHRYGIVTCIFDKKIHVYWADAISGLNIPTHFSTFNKDDNNYKLINYIKSPLYKALKRDSDANIS